MKKDQVAEITIRKAGKMTGRQREKVAEWLRAKAQDLVWSGNHYTTTGHYYARMFK